MEFLIYLIFACLIVGVVFIFKLKNKEKNEYECTLCDDKDCICEKKD